MHALIMLHAVLGEAGAIAFLWVLVELLNPAESRVRRATLAASIGVVLLLLAWVVGGYYYVVEYGSIVKPVIKAGPFPWAHSVITETKEHVFLFIPFLALGAWSIIREYGRELVGAEKATLAALLLSALTVIFAFSMAGMGFLISSGFRGALEEQQVQQAQQTQPL